MGTSSLKRAMDILLMTSSPSPRSLLRASSNTYRLSHRRLSRSVASLTQASATQPAFSVLVSQVHAHVSSVR